MDLFAQLGSFLNQSGVISFLLGSAFASLVVGFYQILNWRARIEKDLDCILKNQQASTCIDMPNQKSGTDSEFLNDIGLCLAWKGKRFLYALVCAFFILGFLLLVLGGFCVLLLVLQLIIGIFFDSGETAQEVIADVAPQIPIYTVYILFALAVIFCSLKNIRHFRDPEHNPLPNWMSLGLPPLHESREDVQQKDDGDENGEVS